MHFMCRSREPRCGRADLSLPHITQGTKLKLQKVMKNNTVLHTTIVCNPNLSNANYSLPVSAARAALSLAP